MLEMHLKLPGFTYCAYLFTLTYFLLIAVHLQKNKVRIEKFMQTGNTDFIYKNELDKGCFQHMAYGKCKDLIKRTQSDKVLKDKAFKIASNLKYGYQREFFDKKSKGSGIVTNEPNDQLANELHKPIIRNF